MQLALDVMDDLLLGTPVSPLYKKLRESGLGESVISDGLETVLQQATYSVGMKGIKDPAQIAEVDMHIRVPRMHLYMWHTYIRANEYTHAHDIRIHTHTHACIHTCTFRSDMSHHQVERLILETLTELSNDGFDQSSIEASLNSLEFRLREFNTGGNSHEQACY